MINVYAPTEVEDTQTKQNFYSELRNAMLVKELKKFKPLLVGYFNAVIADGSCDGFKSIVGLNNPSASIRTTNENGRLLLEFCQEQNLRIANSQFKTKNIHRNTHTLPDGTMRRLDYILVGTQLLKLMKHCRVYNKPTNSWKQAIGTDHNMLISVLCIPCNSKSLKRQLRKNETKKPRKRKWDVTNLRDDDACRSHYCDRLDSIFSEYTSNELNDASNARKVEREFALAKRYCMISNLRKGLEIKPSTLTSYFERHFKKRDDIEMPEELVHPERYPELFDDHKIVINSDPPGKEEIQSALKSFNNGKSYGTDRIPTEALKYGAFSQHLIIAIWLLLQSIWFSMKIPADWLKLSISCLHKKGNKQQAENYRALSVGSNISKILSKIVVTRLKESYEENISKAWVVLR